MAYEGTAFDLHCVDPKYLHTHDYWVTDPWTGGPAFNICRVKPTPPNTGWIRGVGTCHWVGKEWRAQSGASIHLTNVYPMRVVLKQTSKRLALPGLTYAASRADKPPGYEARRRPVKYYNQVEVKAPQHLWLRELKAQAKAWACSVTNEVKCSAEQGSWEEWYLHFEVEETEDPWER